MTVLLISLGLGISGAALSAILWSIVRPERRIWPPETYGRWTLVLVWVPTFALFGIIVALGILEWGQIGLPAWLRFGIGIPLIVIGNIAVLYEASKFGIDQTSGAKGALRTDGLYRFSRNPQYVADTVMIVGWLFLSASSSAAIVGLPGISVLLAAPFAEEPWLSKHYGRRFDSYVEKVRRYI